MGVLQFLMLLLCCLLGNKAVADAVAAPTTSPSLLAFGIQ